MGTTGSKTLSEQYQRLNQVVSSIVDDSNNLRMKDYPAIRRNVCDNVMVLVRRDLNAHANKKDIFDIGKDVYVIPRDFVGSDTAPVCARITDYYDRVLKIILMAKVVLDSENQGDMTFAGIVTKNVHVKHGMLSIAYCNVPHSEKVDQQYVNGVDFGKLDSFNYFIRSVLGEREYRAFLTNLQLQLAHDKKTKMCSDPHMDDVHLSRITGRGSAGFAPSDKAHCRPRKLTGLRIGVSPVNPVFAPDLCYARKHLDVSLADPRVKGALDEFHANYKATLDAVEVLLLKLIRRKDDGAYELRQLPYKGVIEIERGMKRLIKQLHLETLGDFQRLVGAAIGSK